MMNQRRIDRAERRASLSLDELVAMNDELELADMLAGQRSAT